jgi:beta-glucosidase/6-phospho-beta-glucosidase/beta-galactosidase
MITKFDNYNNENKYVNWSDLSSSIKSDICENLRNNIKYLGENYWNSYSLMECIDDSISQPIFKIEYKDVNTLYNNLEKIGWSISELNVSNLMNILKKGIELDPIIINNGIFFDGGHRLTAYKRLNMTMIPTIDIGYLLKFNWKKWDNEEINFKQN